MSIPFQINAPGSVDDFFVILFCIVSLVNLLYNSFQELFKTNVSTFDTTSLGLI